jgi:hypothetical protein
MKFDSVVAAYTEKQMQWSVVFSHEIRLLPWLNAVTSVQLLVIAAVNTVPMFSNITELQLRQYLLLVTLPPYLATFD